MYLFNTLLINLSINYHKVHQDICFLLINLGKKTIKISLFLYASINVRYIFNKIYYLILQNNNIHLYVT